MALNTYKIHHALEEMSEHTEDALTRLYLRLLDENSWSYKLCKERILRDGKSQEIYRKRLNQFTDKGFLLKGEVREVRGKPRIMFSANHEVIHAYIRRYSFTPYEYNIALNILSTLKTREERKQSIKQKLKSKNRLSFERTIFSTYFMGEEISRFFFKLLVISIMGHPLNTRGDSSFGIIYNLFLNLLSNLKINVSYQGIDFIGKRFFLDRYVKVIIELLYSLNYRQRHREIMQIAIVEDVIESLTNPQKYVEDGLITKDETGYLNASYSKRFDTMIEYIESVEDHFVPEYFPSKWENRLACYILYTIEKSIEEPRLPVREFLTHLKENYDVTDKQLDEISMEFRRKIANPVRIWQMNTLL